MRYIQTLQQKVHNTQEALAENEALTMLVRLCLWDLVRTEARMIRGVCFLCAIWIQYHANRPPAALASVNDGTLYMPHFHVSDSPA